ncbi:hypothetical protein AGDE_05572 [Angomonas deanei]|nr:hypothetical protein AGDE_05572 [Angomonas deanei]|eukprot:EPY38357.1 hypothetical protein AGDE_05572 [Angomonas deanei]
MKKHDEECFASFEKRAAVQNFIPSWIIKDGDLKKNASVYTLPLPKHYIDPSDSDEVLEHRKFYHESALKDSKSPPQTKYHPRCGLTGLFFSREEVVDNLQAAAYNLNFTSPFWIHSSHPSLESKYLKVKGGSESICIGLTSSVISVEDIEPFDHSLLHHTLHSKSLASAAKDAPAGMNAISGYVSENPFLKRSPLTVCG